jgi:hypothetical protein
MYITLFTTGMYIAVTASNLMQLFAVRVIKETIFEEVITYLTE